MKLPFILLFVALALKVQAQTPQLVYDIFPGTSSSWPRNLAVANGKLLFSARDTTSGFELRSYDGINPPTLVMDMMPGYDPGYYDSGGEPRMGVMNNKYYFCGSIAGSFGGELMVYDGINPPSMVADIYTGQPGSLPYGFTTIGNKMYFQANSAAGKELCIYDGTNPPSIIDINPTGNSNPHSFTELNGKIYFAATTDITGTELFVYDPATNIAELAVDINPGPGPGLSNIIKDNNKLYFVAYESTYGSELYSFDGTSVTRLTDLAPGSGSGVEAYLVALYNGALYFGGTITPIPGIPPEYDLYKYDIATGITTFVAPLNNYDGIVYADKLYLSASDGINGYELWVHDGTNTTLVADLIPGATSSRPNSFCVYNSKLYFGAFNTANGNELFSFSDPLTISNTKLNGEISLRPNPTTSNATLLCALKASTELSISIIDAAGKIVWKKEAEKYPIGNTEITIPIADKAAGVYFYNVQDNTGATMSSGKLVKQ